MREQVKKQPTVAIIGAGPSGLVSANYALKNGLAPTMFEQSDDIGGVWHPNTGLVWDTMRTNLTHFNCMFTDLPWDGSEDEFPNQAKMYNYLCKYADTFSLRKYLKLTTRVTLVKEFENNHWELTTKDKTGLTVTQKFDYVIVATGIFSNDFTPNFSGLENFKGQIIHSKDYKTSKPFQNKTVAVIGSGFSGIEIAADIANSAKLVHHVFRKPHWVLPRDIPVSPASENSAKWPLDLLFYNRSTRKQVEEIKFRTPEDNKKVNTYMNSICKKQGEVSESLRIPEDTWTSPSMVAISDEYIPDVVKRKIAVKKNNIKEFDASDITTEDGTKISVDTIVMCTGYKLNLSFLDTSILKKLEYNSDDQLQPLILYKCTFHPDLKNIGFVGIYRGPYFAVMELQAKWVNAVFSGKIALPDAKTFETALSEERKIREMTPRPQFPHGDYVGLADSIATEIKCLPDFKNIETNNQDLYNKIFKGPVFPVHYSFVENEKLITDEKQINLLSKQLDEISALLEKRNKAQPNVNLNTAKTTSTDSTTMWSYSKYAMGFAALAIIGGVYIANKYKSS